MTPAEQAARKAGWNFIPDKNGGRFERNASDEPECVWLCGNWEQLCEFAAIEIEQTGYYVTIRRDSKIGYLFGPIAEHGVALALVEPIRALACKIDPWCDFDAFGTSSITTTGTLPQGRLNEHFDKWPQR